MNNVDLNRNFPDQYLQTAENIVQVSDLNRFTDFSQEPETMAIMNWMRQYPFVLSASFHSGAVVAVYPFDGALPSHQSASVSPDDATFRQLASTYSQVSSDSFCNFY